MADQTDDTTTTQKKPLPPSTSEKFRYETHILPRLEWVRWWRRDGMSQATIAERLGVGEPFFRDSKQAHPELEEAMSQGKEYNIKKVEDSLIARANGYSVEEIETIIVTETGGKNDGMVRRTERTHIKHWPPDTMACLNYLYNKDSEHYKDRRHIDASITSEKPVEIIYPPRPEDTPDGSDSSDTGHPPDPEPGT